jgi:hypothetical protein
VSTKFPEIFDALAAPFHPDDVKQRTGGKGARLSYITARTVMNRLDEVMGPENWHFEVFPWGDQALIGTLTLILPGGETVKKCDVGGRAGMQTADDDTKSAASDCLKRCAVLVGVGRSLYNDGQVQFGGKASQKPRDERTPTQRLIDWCNKEGHGQRAEALAARNWGTALDRLTDEQARTIYKLLKDSGAVASIPQPRAREPHHTGVQEAEDPTPLHQPVHRPPGTNGNGNPIRFGWPHSGAALYAWSKKLEAAFKTSIIPQIQEAFSGPQLKPEDRWVKDMRLWSPQQVEAAAVYVATFVKTFPGYSGEFDGKLPPSLIALMDKIWEAAGKLAEAFGAQPTTEVIEQEILRLSEAVAKDFGGEVVTDLQTVTNPAHLKALLEVILADLEASKATY